MLVEALQAVIRTFYHTLGVRWVEHESLDATVRGFCFDPQHDPEATIVLVHGLGDASTTWFPLVPRLREQVRVLAPDLPPFGRSELAVGYAIDAKQHARLLAPLIEEHVVGPTTLVGQSLGGWVAQWLLYENPDLFDSGVLLAPGGTRLEGSYDALNLLTPHTSEEVNMYLEALWYEQPVIFAAIQGYVMDRLHAPEIRGFLASSQREHTLSEDALATIDTPAHIVWGAADRLLDPETPAYLARAWGCPVNRSYLARAGHMVHIERTHAVERIVRDAAGLE